jgi:hypothetical protein
MRKLVHGGKMAAVELVAGLMPQTGAAEWVQTWQSVSSVQGSLHAEEAPTGERIHFGVEFQRAGEEAQDDRKGYRWLVTVALKEGEQQKQKWGVAQEQMEFGPSRV